MIWNCLIFYCCSPSWLAICIIMKIATYLLTNILKNYKLIPYVYTFIICSTDFASQLTMPAEQIFYRTVPLGAPADRIECYWHYMIMGHSEFMVIVGEGGGCSMTNIWLGVTRELIASYFTLYTFTHISSHLYHTFPHNVTPFSTSTSTIILYKSLIQLITQRNVVHISTLFTLAVRAWWLML